MKDLLQTKDMFQNITVSDYLFTKCLLFAKVNLSEEEFILYHKLFDILYPQVIQPDLLIYLHAPVNKLRENIKKRNRSYEQAIEPEYLFSLQETYIQYIKQHHLKTLFIDASNSDFIGNEDHIKTVVDALNTEYEYGQHFINLP